MDSGSGPRTRVRVPYSTRTCTVLVRVLQEKGDTTSRDDDIPCGKFGCRPCFHRLGQWVQTSPAWLIRDGHQIIWGGVAKVYPVDLSLVMRPKFP